MKKLIPAIFVVALIAVFIYSFNASNFDYYFEYDSLDDYDYHFVIIGKESDSKLWDDIYKGAKNFADSNNIALEFMTSESMNNTNEIDFFEMAANSRVDGIIINGYENEQFHKVSQMASDFGIPVIFINEESIGGVRTSYIGVNNYNVGQLSAGLLNKYKTEPLKVAIILDNNDSAQNNMRHESILLALSEFEDMEWVQTLSSEGTKVSLYNDIKSMIKINPDINAIIGTSPVHSEVIGEVLVDLNIVGDILVVGFDDYPATLRYIDKGVVAATVDFDGYEMGEKAVQTLLKYGTGDFVEDVYYLPLNVIDKKSFKEQKGDIYE